MKSGADEAEIIPARSFEKRYAFTKSGTEEVVGKVLGVLVVAEVVPGEFAEFAAVEGITGGIETGDEGEMHRSAEFHDGDARCGDHERDTSAGGSFVMDVADAPGHLGARNLMTPLVDFQRCRAVILVTRSLQWFFLPLQGTTRADALQLSRTTLDTTWFHTHTSDGPHYMRTIFLVNLVGRALEHPDLLLLALCIRDATMSQCVPALIDHRDGLARRHSSTP